MLKFRNGIKDLVAEETREEVKQESFKKKFQSKGSLFFRYLTR